MSLHNRSPSSHVTVLPVTYQLIARVPTQQITQGSCDGPPSHISTHRTRAYPTDHSGVIWRSSQSRINSENASLHNRSPTGHVTGFPVTYQLIARVPTQQITQGSCDSPPSHISTHRTRAYPTDHPGVMWWSSQSRFNSENASLHNRSPRGHVTVLPVTYQLIECVTTQQITQQLCDDPLAHTTTQTMLPYTTDHPMSSKMTTIPVWIDWARFNVPPNTL